MLSTESGAYEVGQHEYNSTGASIYRGEGDSTEEDRKTKMQLEIKDTNEQLNTHR